MTLQHNFCFTKFTSSVRNVILLTCLFFFAPALSALAATYTWDGGGSTNDWSECANWSSNTCPTSADIAQFNSTSVKDATVDTSFGGSVVGVAVNAGYTGIVTQNRNLTIGSSNFTMASGTWAAGTTTFDLNGSFTQSGGDFFAADGTSTVQSNMTLSGGTMSASSTRVFQFDDGGVNGHGTLTCTGAFPAAIQINKNDNGSDFTIEAGCAATTTISALVLAANVSNTLTVNGVLNIAQVATTTITGDVVIGASGTLAINADVIVNAGFTITSGGTFNHNGYIVQFYDTTTSQPGTLTCTGAFPTAIQINKDSNGGDFTIAAGCAATTTGAMVASGGTATDLVINGTLAIPNTSTTTVTGAITIGASGTLAINADVIVNAGFTITSGGTFNHNGYIVQFYDTSSSHPGTLTCTGAFPTAIQINKDSNGGDFTIAAGCAATTTGAVVATGGSATDLVINGTLAIPNTSTTSVTGVITISASGTLTINADVMVIAGFTLTSGGTFNHNGYIVQFYDTTTSQSGTLTCTGAFPTFISIAKDSAASDFTLASGCAATTTGAVVFGNSSSNDLIVDGTLIISQTATTTVTGNLAINGTLTIFSPLQITYSLTLAVAGTINHNNYPIRFFDTTTSHTSTLTCTGIFPTLISVVKSSGNSDFTLASGCTATTTTFVMTTLGQDAFINGTLNLSTSNLQTNGNLTVSASGVINGNGYVIEFNDSGTSQSSTFSCTSTFTSPISVLKDSSLSDFTLSAGCTATTTIFTLSAAGNDATISGTLNLLGTNFSTTGNTTVSSAGRVSLQGNNLTVTGTFSLDGTLALFGSETVTTPTLGDNSTVEFTGTSTYASVPYTTFESLSFTGGGTYTISATTSVEDNMTVSGDTIVTHTGLLQKSGTGTVTTNLTTTFTDLTFVGYTGTTSLAGSGLVVLGDLTIASGTLDVSTSSCGGGSCTVRVGGDWSALGTFRPVTATVTFDGTSAQTASSGLTFYHLQISNTGGAVTFGSSLSASGTFTMVPNTAATFLAAATHTVHTVNWNGEETTSRITLRSTTPATQWVLAPTVIATTSYLNVRDSYNASTSIISCMDGCINSSNNTNWEFPISAGALTITDHPEEQPDNQFTFQNKDDVPLFRFSLTPETEAAVIDDIVISLRGVRNISDSTLSDLRLYRDENDDGFVDGGDIEILGSGIVALSDDSGTITFSTGTTTLSTTTEYIVTGDTTAVKNNTMATFDLEQTGVTALGFESGLTMTVSGNVLSVQHIRTGNALDGSSGQIGGDASAGVVRSGGVQGGGSGDLEAGQGTDGANIAPDPDFFRPTQNGSPHNEWTGGANAYQSDGTYATAASANLRQTYGGFGFAIPGGNTIQGIQVKLDGSGTTAAGTIQVGLSWDGGNTITTLEATPTLSGSDVVYTLGGQSNLWGRSWTATELNDTNFRLRIVAQPSSNTVQLDAIEVRVYHTAGGGGQGGVGEQEL